MVLPPDFACSASVSLSLRQRKLKQFSLGLKVSFVFVLQPSSGWIFRAVLAVEQLVSLGRLLKGSMHVRCMQFFVTMCGAAMWWFALNSRESLPNSRPTICLGIIFRILRASKVKKKNPNQMLTFYIVCIFVLARERMFFHSNSM